MTPPQRQTPHPVDYEAPYGRSKLGRFTIVCLVLNRMIGSGIYVNPSKILEGTGSAGASLFLWSLGAVLSICALLVYHDFGLSTPQETPPGSNDTVCLPCSGGEKNYFEFTLGRKESTRRLATCMYGIPFILIGNLSNNAIAFGRYAQAASGKTVTEIDNHKGETLGIAIAALSVAILMHLFSRRGGIWMNNLFAVLKVVLLLFLILCGGIRSRHSIAWSTHDPYLPGDVIPSSALKHGAFDSIPGDSSGVATWIDSFILVMWAYSGWEQPFYVLSEVDRPRKIIPFWTVFAVVLAAVLFVVLNAVYLLVIPADVYFNQAPSPDIAIVFLQHLFPGTESAQRAERALSALIAMSIFGNILVLTFSASRVKQSIAKEGILPFSDFFATTRKTPYEWLRRRFLARKKPDTNSIDLSAIGHTEELGEPRRFPDQAPIPALFLHWLSSIALIAATSWLPTATAFAVLSTLYTYVIIIGYGFLVSLALIYQNTVRRAEWMKHAAYRTFAFFPFQAVVYLLTAAVVLVGAFIKPERSSLYWSDYWYVVPTIGLSAITTWGAIWYLGIKLVENYRGEDLVVTRTCYPDLANKKHPVLKSETYNVYWRLREPSLTP